MADFRGNSSQTRVRKCDSSQKADSTHSSHSTRVASPSPCRSAVNLALFHKTCLFEGAAPRPRPAAHFISRLLPRGRRSQWVSFLPSFLPSFLLPWPNLVSFLPILSPSFFLSFFLSSIVRRICLRSSPLLFSAAAVDFAIGIAHTPPPSSPRPPTKGSAARARPVAAVHLWRSCRMLGRLGMPFRECGQKCVDDKNHRRRQIEGCCLNKITFIRNVKRGKTLPLVSAERLGRPESEPPPPPTT